MATACACPLSDVISQHHQALLDGLRPTPDSLHPALDLAAYAHLLIPWHLVYPACRLAATGARAAPEMPQISVFIPQVFTFSAVYVLFHASQLQPVCKLQVVYTATEHMRAKFCPLVLDLANWCRLYLRKLGGRLSFMQYHRFILLQQSVCCTAPQFMTLVLQPCSWQCCPTQEHHQSCVVSMQDYTSRRAADMLSSLVSTLPQPTTTNTSAPVIVLLACIADAMTTELVSSAGTSRHDTAMAVLNLADGHDTDASQTGAGQCIDSCRDQNANGGSVQPVVTPVREHMESSIDLQTCVLITVQLLVPLAKKGATARLCCQHALRAMLPHVRQAVDVQDTDMQQLLHQCDTIIAGGDSWSHELTMRG